MPAQIPVVLKETSIDGYSDVFITSYVRMRQGCHLTKFLWGITILGAAGLGFEAEENLRGKTVNGRRGA